MVGSISDGKFIEKTAEQADANPGENSDEQHIVKQNIASISETDNVPNFKETTLLDNEDSAVIEIIIEYANEEEKDDNIDNKDDKDVNEDKDENVVVNTGDKLNANILLLGTSITAVVLSCITAIVLKRDYEE